MQYRHPLAKKCDSKGPTSGHACCSKAECSQKQTSQDSKPNAAREGHLKAPHATTAPATANVSYKSRIFSRWSTMDVLIFCYLASVEARSDPGSTMKPLSREEAKADGGPSILCRYYKSLSLSNKHSLDNALRLAEGTLPIVIGLQEPCDLADSAPYDIMVYGDSSAECGTIERKGCPTLLEIDRCIKKVTNECCSLDDVSILDLNTLHSRQLQSYGWNKLEAQKTFLNIIVAKRPKVIIMLTCTARQSPYSPVHALGSSLRDATIVSTIILRQDGSSHKCVLVNGFHPSMYLRADYRAKSSWTDVEFNIARRVLRLCIHRAFHELDATKFQCKTKSKLLCKWHALLDERQRKQREMSKQQRVLKQQRTPKQQEIPSLEKDLGRLRLKG